MSVSYDFDYFNSKAVRTPVTTGCVVSRFLASYIDFFYVLTILILFGQEGESDSNGIYNFLLLLSLTTLPELLLRQTPGMLLTGMVLVVPTRENPNSALLIRKVMNIVEIALPSFIYYFLVSASKEHKSLSDQVSHCFIVRKKFIYEDHSDKEEIGKGMRVFIALFFSLIPLLTIFMFMFVLFSVFQNPNILDYIFQFL